MKKMAPFLFFFCVYFLTAQEDKKYSFDANYFYGSIMEHNLHIFHLILNGIGFQGRGFPDSLSNADFKSPNNSTNTIAAVNVGLNCLLDHEEDPITYTPKPSRLLLREIDFPKAIVAKEIENLLPYESGINSRSYCRSVKLLI